MQNRFKFRIWSKSEKKMMLFNNPTLIDGDVLKGGLLFKNYDHKITNCHEVNPEDLILMQCTGLRDNSGKLIYEGDIVEVQYIGGQIPMFKNEYKTEPETEVFEIFCHEKWLKFYAKNDYYRSSCEIHSLDLEKILINTYNKVYTVIGNIYENPELLKGDR